jgi:uncharacterized protein
MLKNFYDVSIPAQGDFLVGKEYTFEVGGKKKTYDQVKDLPHSFLVRLQGRYRTK